jgi:hypothetical protein
MDPAAKDAVLRVMADDAFTVLNWARKQGMKREQQLDEVVKAYRKTLADTNSEITLAAKETTP